MGCGGTARRFVPCAALVSAATFSCLHSCGRSVMETVEEVGGRLRRHPELYSEWEKKHQAVAVSPQQRDLLPPGSSGSTWPEVSPFPWVFRRGSCTARACRASASLWGSWCRWEPGSIPSGRPPAPVPLSAAPRPWSLPFPLAFLLTNSVNQAEEPHCHSRGCPGGLNGHRRLQALFKIERGISN